MTSINNKMAKGAAWMVAFKLLERSIGIISTLILARLLIPEDFGLIAMAMSVIAGLELLRAFNFDVVLIQKQTENRKYYDTAWTFNVSFGLITAIILCLIAPYIADFYNEDRLIDIIYVFAFSSFITSFENIGIVDFRKNLEFNKDFKFMLGKKLIGFSVTMILAFTLESYWALVFGTVANKFGGVILSYIMHHFRPKLSLEATKELFNFSAWLMLNNFLFYIKLHSADFIIGRNIGGKELGLFTIAYEISNLPTTELVAPINRAVFPGYSQMTKENGQLKQGFIDVISFVLFFAMPMGVGIAAVAPLLVPVLLGNKWIEIIPIIQILAFFGVTTAMQTNIGSVLLAVGKPKILTFLAAIYVCVLIPILIVLTNSYGISGAAWSYLLVSLLLLPLTYYIIFKELSLTTQELINAVWRPLIASLAMYFAAAMTLSGFSADSSFGAQFIGLISSVLVGILTYSSLILIFWFINKKPDGPEKLILKLIKEKLSSNK